MSAERNITEILSAKELAVIVASITWGHRTEPGLTNEQCRKLVAEIKRLEQDNFALRDGLRGWQATAKAAEERAAKFDDFARIVGEISDVVDIHAPHLEGTLVARVRQVILRAAAKPEAKTVLPFESTPKPCPRCGGSGRIIGFDGPGASFVESEPCFFCRSTGTVLP